MSPAVAASKSRPISCGNGDCGSGEAALPSQPVNAAAPSKAKQQARRELANPYTITSVGKNERRTYSVTIVSNLSGGRKPPECGLSRGAYAHRSGSLETTRELPDGRGAAAGLDVHQQRRRSKSEMRSSYSLQRGRR